MTDVVLPYLLGAFWRTFFLNVNIGNIDSISTFFALLEVSTVKIYVFDIFVKVCEKKFRAIPLVITTKLYFTKYD